MELVRFPSRGGFSVRSIFTFVLAAFTTVLLWTLLASTPAHAADASWNGASLLYEGRDHYLAGTAEAGNGMGIPADSMYYVALEQPTSTGAPTLQKAHVIYLAPGADPPGDGTATYLTFDYNTTTKVFSSPSATQALTVDTASINAQATTCSIEGIGWVVCPVMNFLAWGMDTVFDLIAGFMEVQPLETNSTEGPLFNAWNVMRNIANVAFIIFFIIIIYSQLTNVQVSNYGIKKLLPRLIIAAVAINVSYIICALAVDVSNILGYSIHQLFLDLRNTLLSTSVTSPGNQASLASWESVTGFVLSGGTAAAALGIGAAGAIIATGGTVAAAVFLLLPALVGLLMAILVVLLILAARQALIVILVIIAPLAIVAYLLPNTEKWFTKWRELFVTMLIFFPAFSVVFGGSQLAGAVIIQNADSLNMLILGMIVQVAPLVLTPLILKFSGSLLGGIARLVNNPNKGVIDRTRNWSKGHADWHAARGRGGMKMNGNPGNKGGGLRKASRYLDQRKRRRTDRTGNAETETQTAYENSKFYAKTDKKTGNLTGGIAIQKATAEENKNLSHSHHAEMIDKARRTQGSMIYQPAIDAQAHKEKAEVAQNATTSFYNRVRSDKSLASRVGAGALYNSSYNLETSKGVLEASENTKAAFYNTQRTITGTSLNMAVKPLETSKLQVEVAQNNYTGMVENMKMNKASQISVVAQTAQSSKEHLEAAQSQLQAFFDTQRADSTTPLYTSSRAVESSKSVAEEAKARLTAQITNERSTAGSSLYDVSIRAETAKQVQQESEARFTRIVDEYRAGGEIDATTGAVSIDGRVINATQQALANEMHESAARLSAEKQGATSAQYVQQERINTLMDENSTDPLTAVMLKTAGGIDPNGQIRAQANAISQLDKLQKEALGNSVTLLGDRAEKNDMTIVALAKEMYAKQVGTYKDAAGNLQPREQQDPAMLEAAFEALAQDGAVPVLRDARLDTNAPFIDQDMLTRLFARHSPTMKAKGGFDLQADPSLAGASRERMDVSIAGSLGDVTASNIANQKAGWWEEVADRIDTIITNTESYAYDPDPTKNEAAKKSKMDSLQANYQNVTMALTNPNVLKDIGDRLEYTITIHQKLHAHFKDPAMYVDYDLARKGQGPKRRS